MLATVRRHYRRKSTNPWSLISGSGRFDFGDTILLDLLALLIMDGGVWKCDRGNLDGVDGELATCWCSHGAISGVA